MALIIINPVCGDRSAPAYFKEHVKPLLKDTDISAIVETKSAEDAGAQIAAQGGDGPLTVILCSGDGTLHDIVNALRDAPPRAINFVLVPCGTANALYAALFPGQEDKLLAVRAFLAGGTPRRLSLASTTVAGETRVSAVVVSTALHAAILHDSESLRATHPGIERFKIAAQQNSKKWYHARARLTGPVAKYDVHTRAFGEAREDVELEGPFAYFLAVVNVDRLEPAFRIAPLGPGPAGTCDVVVVRPLRAPGAADTPEGREAFSARTWDVLGAAYSDGAHVRKTYEDGSGVVEYFRCKGWEWVPEAGDEGAHLVCTDGAISRVADGGRAVCVVDAYAHELGVFV